MTLSRGEKTRRLILTTGLKMWKKDPDSVTANKVAKAIGMGHATVLYHFPEGVKNAVAEYAVERGDKRVMAQLIVAKHPAVAGLSAEDRRAVLDAV